MIIIIKSIHELDPYDDDDDDDNEQIKLIIIAKEKERSVCNFVILADNLYVCVRVHLLQISCFHKPSSSSSSSSRLSSKTQFITTLGLELLCMYM